MKFPGKIFLFTFCFYSQIMALDLEKEVSFKYPLKDVCFLSFSVLNSFIEVKFTYYTVHSFKVYSAVTFGP